MTSTINSTLLGGTV